jgi:hypothetical protein
MKKFITSFIFLSGTLCFFSQNLVRNGSFETYSSCPTGYAQVNKSKYWIDPTGSSSDYLNSCAGIMTGINVPYLFFGYDYQHARTGAGFTGLSTYSDQSTNFRDYIMGQVSSALIGGKSYCVSFYCNLNNRSKFSTNKIGLYLSIASTATVTPPYLLTYSPQVFTDSLISDSLKWTEVNGIFVSNGGESYVTIGNFFSDSNTSTQIFNSSSNYSTYYLIDDVSIEELKPVQLKNDTVLTFCDSMVLGNNLDSASVYSWWPNKNISDTTSPNPTAWPDSTTTYYVTKTQCTSVTTDSIKITVVSCDVGEKEYGVPSPVVRVFPNPGDGIFKIKYSIEKNSELEIHSVTGQRIKSFFLAKEFTEKEIDLSDLENGIYFYSLIDNRKSVYSGKVIISR